jgi:hypothetical protein
MCYTKIMDTPISDTNPKIEQLQIEIIQRMPSWRKIALVDDLNETVKVFAISGIRQRYPDASPEQIHRRLADLMLGPELASKVYDHAR